jgi:hypothetical protein
MIGSFSDVSSSSQTNSTAIGYNSLASASNQVRIGNTAITSLHCQGAYAGTVGLTRRDVYVDNLGKIGYISSSLRYKKNINNLADISWIYKLRPVNYTYKNDKNNTIQYGLIAEEVEQVNSDFVSYNEDGSVETVSYSQLVTPMLKALQDQQELIRQLQNRIEQLEN